MKKSVARPEIWQPAQPYNSLPLLPPREEVESKAILKQCIRARAALAELKQAAATLPSEAVLVNTLPMLEAKASSEIENIVTTADRLFQHRDADDNADPATKEALRYSSALLHGFASLSRQPLNVRTAERVCTEITGVEMRVRRIPGTALANSRSGLVIYTPPVGEDLLRNLLSNWEAFLHTQDEVDPLIRMAIAHYQFEAIHPFTDGNGRTGRVLNNLFLISEGLLALPILYLSRYFISSRSQYYENLLEVTRSRAWEKWILYVLRGVEETSGWTSAKIVAIRQLLAHTADFARRRAPKLYSRELIDLIFEKPYCRIEHVVSAGLLGRQAASRYLKKLVDIGVLEEVKQGREKLFVHPKLMRLLTKDGNAIQPYR